MQGPWAVSHPARWIGALALSDKQWQKESRKNLALQSNKLHIMLSRYFKNIHSSHYFCYLPHVQAKQLKHQLAKQGIWVRFFDMPSAIRIGLPLNDEEFYHLNTAFLSIFHMNN